MLTTVLLIWLGLFVFTGALLWCMCVVAARADRRAGLPEGR